LLSVVIAVRDPDRAAPLPTLYRDYAQQLETLGWPYEFVFAVEGTEPSVLAPLRRLRDRGEPVAGLAFSRWYGGATALAAAFGRAEGDVVLTLPAYHQIDPAALPSLFPPLDAHDMVVVRLSPRVDSLATRLQTRAYHAALRGLLGVEFRDLGCSVVAFRAEVLEAIERYGDPHRFLPVLARHLGFSVHEVAAPQCEEDTFQRHFSVRTYVHRLLDLLSVFFLTRFTHKPLRFFGAAGGVALLGGGGITGVLAVQRLFWGVPLQDKPMLLLGILLIVLGTLLFAIGLIGEMIIFTTPSRHREYVVEEVIE